MEISRRDLDWAVTQGLVSAEQAEALWTAFEKRAGARPRFDLATVSYYFGALGVFGYLGDLAHRVFKDSLLFPFALSLLGILVIYLGIQYQRHREGIERFLLTRIPPGLRRLLPMERLK